MSIYTKKGDNGFTQLFSGQTVSKSCKVFESLRLTDALSVLLGQIIGHIRKRHEREEIKNLSYIAKKLQQTMFDLGSHIATPINMTKSESKLKQTSINKEYVEFIETQIDFIQSQLPKQTKFVLPMGNDLYFMYNVARIECRRLESSIVEQKERGFEVGENVLSFVNRLSDYFFICGRYVNFVESDGEFEEEYYINSRK